MNAGWRPAAGAGRQRSATAWLIVLGACAALSAFGSRDRIPRQAPAHRALAQGTPSAEVDVEAAVLEAARARLDEPLASASVAIDEPAPGVVRYILGAMVMAGAVDALEIRRYPSEAAAAEAVAALGGGVGFPLSIGRDSGGISSYAGHHFQVARWFAWAQGRRVFKAERQYVSTLCGDAPSPASYAVDLALAAVDGDLIPSFPLPLPTATCATPLEARVANCATDAPSVLVSGTTREGACTVSVHGGAEVVAVTVSDGSFMLDVALPEIGRIHRLNARADCGEGCVASRGGPALTTWRLPVPTPDGTSTATTTSTPTVPITGTLTATATPSPTPTGTRTGSPTPSPSPTTYRVLDLEVSADLARVSHAETRLTAGVNNLGPALAVEWDLELWGEPAGLVFFLGEPTISGAFVTACRMTEGRSRYSCRMGPLPSRGLAEIGADVGHIDHGPPSSQVCVRIAYPPAGVTGRDTNPDNDLACVNLGLSMDATPTPTPTPESTPAVRLSLPWLERQVR